MPYYGSHVLCALRVNLKKMMVGAELLRYLGRDTAFVKKFAVLESDGESLDGLAAVSGGKGGNAS
jgi:hypothetical protein